MADRFLIAPINTGLQTNMKPFLIPDDAFALLQNAYIYRGRVVKRVGSRALNGNVNPLVAQLYTRLGIKIGTTNAITGNLAGTVPGSIWKVGQLFAVDNEILTVVTAGVAQPLLTTGASVSTYSTTNGAFSIVGAAPNTDVYFYPAEPVMGIVTYEQPAITPNRYIFFDTQFAYEFDGTRFQRLANGGASAVWHGTNSNFFWGKTYRGLTADLFLLFVSNYYVIGGPSPYVFDPIRYLDPNNIWHDFFPIINGPIVVGYLPDHLISARCIISFKGCLIFLNTWEEVSTTVLGAQVQTATQFVNRIRFNVIGNPLDTNAYNETVNRASGAGSLDIDTQEAILSCGFIKDRLIVFCERSTYELVWTGNRTQPFVFQRLNSELGVYSTFSSVPFDQVILGVGQTGIHACNGSNVTRIDQKIPHQIFEVLQQNNGQARVQGIRDYYLELVYWIVPSNISIQSIIFPNQMIVYNYRTNSWAINDDSFTALGNIQVTGNATWANTDIPWEDISFTWGNAQITSQFLNVVAGNQEGFVCIIDPGATTNADGLSITNINVGAELLTLTIIDHNLITGSFIQVNNIQAIGGTLSTINGRIYEVTWVDNNTITIDEPGLTGTYAGGGTIARITPIDILTKEYNFYLKDGVNFSINAIDFHIDSTANGQFNVDYFTSTSNESLFNQGEQTNTSFGNGVVTTNPYPANMAPYEANASRLWHRFYPQADGEFIQLRLYIDVLGLINGGPFLPPPDQQVAFNIISSEFVLHGILFHTMPTASRLQ